jgi:hypothetical protein
MLKSSDYIGKIVISRFPYFDISSNKIKFKARPVLIIGCEFEELPCDFNVLPISKVSDGSKINNLYDFKLNKIECDKLNLKSIPSYIRTHKQYIVNSRDVHSDIVSDLKNDLKNIYDEVEKLNKKYNSDLF